MGAPGKWLKSLITLKKPHATNQVSQNISNQTLRFSSSVFVSGFHVFIVYVISVLVVQDKVGDNTKKKWRLWRSSSEGMNRGKMFASKASDSSSGAFNSAIATVMRAQPKDFMVIKQEWAAIRIQSVFRGFLVN
jgi:hypothetical protein